MTIGDVIKTPMFAEGLQKRIASIDVENTRLYRKAEAQGLRLKAHPIEVLKREGNWNVGNLAVLYAEICNKVCKLPTAQREYIVQVCQPVLLETIETLKNETTEDDGQSS